MIGGILNAIAGIWLMVAPALFHYNLPASDNDRITGPIVVTFGVISLWEVTRAVNQWNFAAGLWLFISPVILSYSHPSAAINSFVTGVLILIFSSLKGKTKRSFGGGWMSLWKNQPLDE